MSARIHFTLDLLELIFHSSGQFSFAKKSLRFVFPSIMSSLDFESQAFIKLPVLRGHWNISAEELISFAPNSVQEGRFLSYLFRQNISRARKNYLFSFTSLEQTFFFFFHLFRQNISRARKNYLFGFTSLEQTFFFFPILSLYMWSDIRNHVSFTGACFNIPWTVIQFKQKRAVRKTH